MRVSVAAAFLCVVLTLLVHEGNCSETAESSSALETRKVRVARSYGSYYGWGRSRGRGGNRRGGNRRGGRGGRGGGRGNRRQEDDQEDEERQERGRGGRNRRPSIFSRLFGSRRRQRGSPLFGGTSLFEFLNGFLDNAEDDVGAGANADADADADLSSSSTQSSSSVGTDSTTESSSSTSSTDSTVSASSSSSTTSPTTPL
ncbi:uncharacterized protein [Watersipora subatra]|uniref:uncharacterized protein n=1 Tax=Watersipora subatra TaxID=2589382 RepID=UPI00355C9E24